MQASFELKSTVLIYQDHDRAVCTINPVSTDKDGRPVIGAGRAIGRAGLSRLVNQMAGMKDHREVFDERILFVDGGCMAWWSPSRRAPIYFKTKDHRFNAGMGGELVMHPALLFVAQPSKLSIFALGSDNRPTGKTALYRAPYYNVYDEGNMCAGNIGLPNTVFSSDMPEWERCFFDTEFTHTNVRGRGLCQHPHGHAGFWWSAKRQEAVTMVRYLSPLKLTVTGAINQ